MLKLKIVICNRIIRYVLECGYYCVTPYIYKSRNLLLVYMLFGALFFVLDLFQVVHSVLIKVGHRKLSDQV